MMREHGGTDANGVPRWDFSTNANACGPCPVVLESVRRADAAHYPDPRYTALREALALFHQVDFRRIVVGTSASELISRITACAFRAGARRFWQPALAYGDYALAAQAWRLHQVDDAEQADLVWLCEPSSPLGVAESQCVQAAVQGRTVVIDRAYEPLRLAGQCSFTRAELDAIWQLWSPNKAMGLTGVRGAYAIAPLQSATMVRELEDMAASWPLGAHGVAMLHAWTGVEAQQWLIWSRHRLSAWKQQQLSLLEQLGWECLPSVTNYFSATAPTPVDEDTLREHGVKLRDTRTLGLPGYWRLSVQSPEAQGALRAALIRRKERVT
ncbi:histidinol-phosphate aminotransferase [Hydrogenophaga palleronii]|uniref:histidinol-phosphate transaminase n=1 Tax=Hydrogenophaga palleronii TaxID=65655 RepID=A0ABU1WHD5_9BURK|nr:aminotransferase class I/II-fold pyridoxal phosphate-dependent enzyme [Hydrogenophaga palleronii]MDR7148677.1 histidinol-phosphate aminotransferase [Hydrogenophaga palleronii]